MGGFKKRANFAYIIKVWPPTHIDSGPVINIPNLIEKVDEAETLKINATENTQAENK